MNNYLEISKIIGSKKPYLSYELVRDLFLHIKKKDYISATMHPLGFIKIILFTNSELPFQTSDELRIHIWPKTNNLYINNSIHNHPWDFTSLVICGSVLHTTYKLEHSESGMPLAHVEYSATGSVRILSDDKYIPKQLDKKLVEANEKYQLLAGSFHFVEPFIKNLCVTLVYSGKNQEFFPSVLVKQNDYHESFLHEEIDHSIVKKYCEKISALIKKA